MYFDGAVLNDLYLYYRTIKCFTVSHINNKLMAIQCSGLLIWSQKIGFKIRKPAKHESSFNAHIALSCSWQARIDQNLKSHCDANAPRCQSDVTHCDFPETVSDDSMEIGRISLQDNQSSLSGGDMELSCDSQARLIVWLQMGNPDKLHSPKEQVGLNTTAAMLTEL